MKWKFASTGTEIVIAQHVTDRIIRDSSKTNGPVWGAKTEADWRARTMRGQLAELIVARALNVYPNLEDSTPAARQRGWDLIYGDSTIDVKCPDRVGSPLRVPRREPMHHADAYVVVYQIGDAFELCGWCWWHEIIGKHRFVSRGDGRNDKWYELPADELSAMADIHYVQLGLRRVRDVFR